MDSKSICQYRLKQITKKQHYFEDITEDHIARSDDETDAVSN